VSPLLCNRVPSTVPDFVPGALLPFSSRSDPGHEDEFPKPQLVVLHLLREPDSALGRRRVLRPRYLSGER